MESGGTRLLWPPGKSVVLFNLQIEQHWAVIGAFALTRIEPNPLGLYGQAARAISTG